jgi:hypothetical protein
MDHGIGRGPMWPALRRLARLHQRAMAHWYYRSPAPRHRRRPLRHRRAPARGRMGTPALSSASRTVEGSAFSSLLLVPTTRRTWPDRVPREGREPAQARAARVRRTGRKQLHDLRRHLGDPAPRDRPQHLRPAHSLIDAGWARPARLLDQTRRRASRGAAVVEMASRFVPRTVLLTCCRSNGGRAGGEIAVRA